MHIAALAVDDEGLEDEAEGHVMRFEGTMTIPFKNENLYAEVDKGDGGGPKVLSLFIAPLRAPRFTTLSPSCITPCSSRLRRRTKLTLVTVSCRS